MGFFSDIIKQAHESIEWDGRDERIIFPIQKEYIRVKSKYRGLEGGILCVQYNKGYTWHTSRRSFKRALNKLAYAGNDYLVIDDIRASLIIIGNQEGVITRS